jgi:hypothetical protein
MQHNPSLRGNRQYIGNPLHIKPCFELPPPPPDIGYGGASIAATNEGGDTILHTGYKFLDKERMICCAAVKIKLPPIKCVPVIIGFLDGHVCTPVTSISHHIGVVQTIDFMLFRQLLTKASFSSTLTGGTWYVLLDSGMVVTFLLLLSELVPQIPWIFYSASANDTP